MDKIIAALLVVLDEEISVYRELLDLARQRQELFGGDGDDIKVIEKITAREAQLAQSIAVAERKRIQVMDDLASHQGSHLVAATLAELAASLAEPYSQALLERRQLIVQLITELKTLNTLNKKLIDQELAYISFSVNLLTGEDDPKLGYSDLGQRRKKSPQRNFVDWKA